MLRYVVMKSNNSSIFETLDNYFKKIDDAPISPSRIFVSEIDKERYETLFMYAFEKYRAARYHYENVKKFIKIEDPNSKNSKMTDTEPIKINGVQIAIARSWSCVSLPADHYVFELSAFLAALRSSIDFLCIACSHHLPGIKTRSIATLIKLVEKGRSGPIFKEVNNNIKWLNKLRSYRDHLIHNLVISASSGYETHRIGNLSKTIRYPVIIPESPPSFILDTRMRRMMEESSSNLDRCWSEIHAKTENGKEEIADFSLKFVPPAGYIIIEDFMQYHLDSYEKFFTEIIQALEDLRFKTCDH